MALQIDTVNHACDLITRQIRESFRHLTVKFIIHHSGQLTEALALAAQDILAHPAADTAMHIMRKKRNNEESSLLGTAVAREQILFGLASRETALSLCTLNIDNYETIKEVRRHAFHLAWHAIDAYEYHNAPTTREEMYDRVIIRKRNALDMAAANLRADAFSALICTLKDDYEAIRKIAQRRGLESLSKRTNHTPEYYPFVIATEATEFAAQQLRQRNLPARKILQACRQTADHIGQTFEDVLLRQWLGFSQPAQDMAWRGFSREEILAAAIHTSPSTYVRAAGYMISEVTYLEPASILTIRESYSPFADDNFNEKLHKKLVDRIFEDVIAEGLKRNSSDPFREVAERQNQDITEGRVAGWCAAALQSAARGFDSALAHGSAPAAAAAARREFENEKDKTPWESLKALGRTIIRQTRTGNPVTLSSIPALAGDNPGLAPLRKSVENTIKTPSYQLRLQNVNELHAGITPRSPEKSPQAAKPSTAIPVAPILGIPGLGGRARPAPIQQPAQQESDQQKDRS